MIIVGYLGFSLLSQEYRFINNTILEPLGLDAINWYSEPKYWPLILTTVQLWKGVGYNCVIYLAAIIGIDQEYYEAATIDGATKWQQVTRITIPLIMPIIVILTLLDIGRIMNADFGLFYQVPLDSGALYSTTNVIDTYVYRALLRLGDIGMSSAAVNVSITKLGIPKIRLNFILLELYGEGGRYDESSAYNTMVARGYRS